ncbi:MAG: ribonuclease R [Candidatus Cloacimonetes bacterium]|nr:ribonuclease R [Candidatus Cloacimonadota bacterium]MBS3766540.1 ribonuclease R [Candidatus Cloacimonadota bacterium]
MAKDLYDKILNILNNNTNKYYKVHKICRILGVKKKNRNKVKKTLNRLVKNGKIVRKGKKYTSRKNFNKTKGRFDSTALSNDYSFGFVNTNKFDILIYRENCLNAFNGDTVEVVIVKSNKRNKKKVGKITKIIERDKTEFVGNIHITDGTPYLVPDEPKIDQLITIEDESVKFKDIKDKKVVVSISDWGNRATYKSPKGIIKKILGDKNDPKIDYLSVVNQFGLPDDFPAQVKSEVEKISPEISQPEVSRRKDFRNITTFTIDPEDAKDFDDAISIEKIDEGFRLYIHIADVSHYVSASSASFKEAFRRCTSIYLLQNVIPMLHNRISTQICSLQPGEDKLTISVIFDFDKNFNLLRKISYPSIINSDQRLNYNQVDQLFKEGYQHKITDKVKFSLKLLRPIAKHLTKQRYERGGLDFDLPDTEFEFDEKGSPVGILRTRETESHLLIEEFMLLANSYVADLIAKKCNSAIFRIHDEPDPAKLGEFAMLAKAYGYKLNFSQANQNLVLKKFLDSLDSKNEHQVFDILLLRSMKKAKYSHMNSGHFGLALDSYTHFTSPIRRFPDLIVHHLLKQAVFGWSPKKFTLDDIKSYAKRSSAREVQALDAERTLGKIKKNRFMQEHKNRVFTAIITNFNNKNMFVELEEYPIQGFIPFKSIKDDYYKFNQKNYRVIGKNTNKQFHLCQKVKVKVKEVIHSIEFELIS